MEFCKQYFIFESLVWLFKLSLHRCLYLLLLFEFSSFFFSSAACCFFPIRCFFLCFSIFYALHLIFAYTCIFLCTWGENCLQKEIALEFMFNNVIGKIIVTLYTHFNRCGFKLIPPLTPYAFCTGNHWIWFGSFVLRCVFLW